jgi:hypoxanthine phosphoribosyltransferase
MQVKLKTGTINIETNHLQSLERLTGFSSRPNKKRGFVFVSKVLGHRYPTKPSVMENVYRELAAQIRVQLDNQPTMVIGLVEAAAGLGYGIYHHLGLSNAFYMHTTYYRLSQPIWISFKEEHSHAPTHLLYDTPLSDLRDRVKNVVLIDDEFSTGKTLFNFVTELRKQLPQVERFIGAAILDWIPNELPDIRCVSLHKGDYTFDWKPNIQLKNPSVAVGTQEQVLDDIIPHNFGLLGIQTLNIPCQDYINIDQFRYKKVLVLGTGECMYPAFLIAQSLEEAGVDVYVQTTSRAPYNVDNDLESKVTFKDNYHENIDNFFYNPKQYDSILICYETISLPKNHDLPQQLRDFAPEVITLFIRSET